MAARNSAQVHRFHGSVAVCLPVGPTHYLTEKEARQLSKALLNCARDIKRQTRFSQSEFTTVQIPVIGDE